jgi:RecG-like helicase
MVIGTHTLIADKTNFSALRISVIDEQQRFGVVQRGRFNNKVIYLAVYSHKILTRHVLLRVTLFLY